MSTPPIHLDFNSFGFERKKIARSKNVLKLIKKGKKRITWYVVLLLSNIFNLRGSQLTLKDKLEEILDMFKCLHIMWFLLRFAFFCFNLWFRILWRFDFFWIHLNIIEELKYFSKNSYLNCFIVIVIVIIVMVVSIHHIHITWWIKHCKRDRLF